MKFASLDDLAYAVGEIAKRTAYIQKKEAQLNEKISALRSRFEDETAEAKAEAELLKQDVEAYCMKNKAAFDEQRTLVFLTGKVGFRNNPPKVTQLNRKYTVASSIELIQRIFKGLYIRLKEEIDKDSILSDYREKKVTDQKLAAVGLKVDQSETFFIEPDLGKYTEARTSIKV